MLRDLQDEESWRELNDSALDYSWLLLTTWPVGVREPKGGQKFHYRNLVT